MKKSLLSILSALFTTLVFAQIPNGDFETWTNQGSYSDPNGWVTTNALSQLGNPKSVFQSSDAHSGLSACEVEVVKITTKFPGVFIPDYTGSLFTGNQVGLSYNYGFPYTGKPTKLGFWYKYNARNGDTATVVVATTRWNSSTSQRDTIAVGYGLMKDSVGVYTKNEIMLYVFDSINSPDSAVIIISASTIFATHEGAKLILDDLAFEGGNVGLNTVASNYAFEVYPNPASKGGVNIVLDNVTKDATIVITDVNGKIVFKEIQQYASRMHLSTENLSSGFYFIRVNSSQGSALKKLIIE
jgi:hypothetical protein